MKRVALYCRVSTEEQNKHGLSMGEQEKTLTDYASTHKMKIVGKYLDGGVSARKKYTHRPELMRLLADVRADKIDTILFIKLDRWFRNVADYYEVQKILDDHNVTWQATEEDYETVTASGRFKVNIMLSVAQDEADRASERIKFIFEGKKERNEPIGTLPFGYIRDGKKAIPDPVKAPLIKQAFEYYFETGMPSKVIAKFPELELNYTKLRRMLRNPAYIGEFQGMHIPPIIPKEYHDRAMAMRKTNSRKSPTNRTYLFSGLVFCPVCGHRMGARYLKGGRHYYVCDNHSNMRGCTFGKMVREDRIESYLLEHIDGKINLLLKAQGKDGISYESQRESIRRKLTRLSELYVNEMVSMEDYKRQYNSLNAELESIPPDVQSADTGKLQERFFENWQDIYNELKPEEKRAFWREALDSISLNTDGSVKDFSFSNFTT